MSDTSDPDLDLERAKSLQIAARRVSAHRNRIAKGKPHPAVTPRFKKKPKTSSERRQVADLRSTESARTTESAVRGLADSIKKIGLLHPIVINSRNEVIAGRRRLAAVKLLGWTTVAVTVISSLDDALFALWAERDENTERLNLTPSEMVAIGREIEKLEQPRARSRQGMRTDRPQHSGNLPESSRGQTRDKVASALGVSGKTYEKAKAVVDAAEKEPEKFGNVAAKMDETGKVDPAYKAVKIETKATPTSETVIPKPPDQHTDEIPGPRLAKLIQQVQALHNHSQEMLTLLRGKRRLTEDEIKLAIGKYGSLGEMIGEAMVSLVDDKEKRKEEEQKLRDSNAEIRRIDNGLKDGTISPKEAARLSMANLQKMFAARKG